MVKRILKKKLKKKISRVNSLQIITFQNNPIINKNHTSNNKNKGIKTTRAIIKKAMTKQAMKKIAMIKRATKKAMIKKVMTKKVMTKKAITKIMKDPTTTNLMKTNAKSINKGLKIKIKISISIMINGKNNSRI